MILEGDVWVFLAMTLQLLVYTEASCFFLSASRAERKRALLWSDKSSLMKNISLAALPLLKSRRLSLA
jgi:hypothetical protein